MLIALQELFLASCRNVTFPCFTCINLCNQLIEENILWLSIPILLQSKLWISGLLFASLIHRDVSPLIRNETKVTTSLRECIWHILEIKWQGLLRSFGHVWHRVLDTPVQKFDKLVGEGMRRGRRDLRWHGGKWYQSVYKLWILIQAWCLTMLNVEMIHIANSNYFRVEA